MSKRVYIGADYAEDSDDRDVVDTLNQWRSDSRHKADFIDMSKVVSDSVSSDPDRHPCDSKRESNQQINVSSVAIFIASDKTVSRKADSSCSRVGSEQADCSYIPYK